MEGMKSPHHSSMLSSPFLSPNVSALLKIKILSWSQETGFPVCIRVRVADRTFSLHKHPLISKSGYFLERLKDSDEVELPSHFPGGATTFEMIALFIYGSSTLVDPFNVASLRCAAEFLQMTEEYGSGNLCERFDIYLNQVVFQSWDDTLIVLQKCQALLPLAEELLIVSRCIETLAFMACMEILDPERRRDQPVITLEALASIRPWNDQTVIEDVFSRDLWIKDLIALPFPFFKRIVGSLRRQGMKEKYVTPIILFFAHKCILNIRKTDESSSPSPSSSSYSHKISEDSSSSDDTTSFTARLQGIIDLLPTRGLGKTSKGIPIGLYLSLLSTSLELELRDDSVEKLQNQIASVLHLARMEDLILGTTDHEMSIMETIFSTYFSCNDIRIDDHAEDHYSTPCLGNNCIVGELWDRYLSHMAADSNLSCKRFMTLIDTVPVSGRRTHDHLYRSMNTFFLSHPHLSQEEKGQVCKYLNCQKLSQQICIEAVQNDLMPLRLIVHALFVQQLHTQQAFRECSDSFRYTGPQTHCGVEFSAGSLSSTRSYANSKSQTLGESPYTNNVNIDPSEDEDMISNRPLSTSFLLQKDLSVRRPEYLSCEISRKEYESTSFRIQNLEKELMSLKRSLQISQQNTTRISQNYYKQAFAEEPSEKKLLSIRSHCLMERKTSKKMKKSINFSNTNSCIGTVNFASQRKYVNKLLKILRRISLFGRGGGGGRSSKRSMSRQK